MVEQQREIDGRTNRDKEKPEQQPFEWCDIAFQFVPIFAVCEHHAGKESAQCR